MKRLPYLYEREDRGAGPLGTASMSVLYQRTVLYGYLDYGNTLASIVDVQFEYEDTRSAFEKQL